MSAKKTKKHRKHDRNKVSCKVYALSKRREHNKLRRLVNRLKTHPLDKTAIAAAGACRIAIRGC